MVSYLPLPNEIIKKIYGYVLPIFEYTDYMKNIAWYNDTNIDANYSCQMFQDLMMTGDPLEKLSNVLDIMDRVGLQQSYLVKINEFLEKNRSFVRPGCNCDLSEYQFRRAFDTEITEYNMKRMEDNIWIRRGMWCNPDEKNEILLYHDFVFMLHYKSTRSLFYSSIVNGINFFPYNDWKELQSDKDSAAADADADDVAKFINETYPNINYSKAADQLRRVIIKLLMKL